MAYENLFSRYYYLVVHRHMYSGAAGIAMHIILFSHLIGIIPAKESTLKSSTHRVAKAYYMRRYGFVERGIGGVCQFNGESVYPIPIVGHNAP